MRARLWSLGLIALAGALVVAFSPVLGNAFVWDDGSNIVFNPHLKTLDLELLKWAFGSFRVGHYQPLSWLSLALDRALFGLNPAGYHLTSLLVHILNVLLFAVLARQLLKLAREDAQGGSSAVGALVAAAVFGLHPMRVESVAWATERRDVLAGFFFLLALLAYLRMVRVERSAGTRRWWLAAALTAFALSLFSKALALGLPLVLLVLDWYPLRRWHLRASWRSGLALLAEKLPFFLLSLVFGIVALKAQAAANALVSISKYGWLERSFHISYSASFYPRALFARAWSPLYERPTQLDPLEPRFLIPAIAFAALTGALVAFRRRFPAGLAVWASYLVLLAPVSGLAQSGVQLVADRYAYLAGLGFALLMGAGFAFWSAPSRGRVERGAVALVTGAALITWTVLTWKQTEVWRDDLSLWRHVVTLERSAMAYNNLGAIALRSGDPGEALRLLRQAVEVAPAFGLPWRNLLALFEQWPVGFERDQLRRTEAALKRSLPNHAGSAAAWTTIALVHLALGEPTTAARELRRAVEVNPRYVLAWRRLALIQLSGKQYSACRDSYREAVRLEPKSASSWTGLGLCLEGGGARREAVAAFKRAIWLEPSATEALRHLKNLRAEAPP